MEKKKPLKRHKALIPLSREHHHSLLLCWKLRKGFSRGIAPERMKLYSDWFFKEHVHPHFKVEETYVFPMLGNNDPMVKRALAEHRRLERLFQDDKEVIRSLNLIEEELEKHVRFEERELFMKIQEHATPEQLAGIEEHLTTDQKFRENTEDEFWL